MKSWTLIVGSLLAFVLVPFALFGEQAESFIAGALEQRTGPDMAIFLVFVLIADVLLPIPSSLVSSYACQQYGPSIGFILIALGMTGSFALAYGLGNKLGTKGVRKILGAAGYERAQLFGQQQGALWGVAFSRAIPVLAEGVGLMAGALRWPLGKSFFWSTLSHGGVALAYALFFWLWGSEAGGGTVVFASILMPTLGMILSASLSARARSSIT